MSIRDTALNQTLRSAIVDVPEWDAKVLVREMTAQQREKFINSERDDGLVSVDVAITCALDPDTEEPVFDPADRDHLAGGPAAPIERIFGKVVSMSRADETSTVEAEKELQADPLDDSSSG